MGELNLPATPETVYQIQSLTKSFTATGIMMLVEEGKVGLDHKLTVIVLANCNGVNAAGIAQRIARLYIPGLAPFGPKLLDGKKPAPLEAAASGKT